MVEEPTSEGKGKQDVKKSEQQTAKKTEKSSKAKKKGKAKQKPTVFEPVIKQVPKFTSSEQLLAFLKQPKIINLRPQGKVVGILHSSKMQEEHSGLMFRKRVGKKEKNLWKQVI